MIDRIYCKNFRRIGECNIELRDGVTVLIGKNGTGKSSIIEAITFNLYGETIKAKGKKESCRRIGASEDELTYTVVDFTFNGVHYRCRRWYTKKMSMNGNLYSFNDEEFAKLQEQPIEEFDKGLGSEVASGTTGTTAAVTEILGVNYKGFLASFLAQQKELDALANLPAERRKEFFLEVLGYDRLEKMKSELGPMVKETKRWIDQLSKQQKYTVPQLEKKIAKSQDNLRDLIARVEKGTQMVEAEQLKLDEAAVAYENVRVLAEKVTSAETDLTSLQQEDETLVADIARLNESIAENEKKSAGYDASSSITEKLAAANERLTKSQQYDNVAKRKEESQGELAARETEYKQNMERLAELEKLTETEPNTYVITNAIADIKAERSAVMQEKKTAEIGRDKMSSLLKSVESGDVAECPSCGTEISSETGKQHLASEVAKYEESIAVCSAKDAELEKKQQEQERKLENENRRLATFKMNETEKNKLASTNSATQRTIDDLKKTIAQQDEELKTLEQFKLTRDDRFALNEEILTLNEQKKRETAMQTAFYQLKTDREMLTVKQEQLAKNKKAIDEKSAFVKANKREAAKLDKKAEEKDIAREKTAKFRAALDERKVAQVREESELATLKGELTTAKHNAEDLKKNQHLYASQVAAQEVIGTLRQLLPSRIAPRLADVASHILDIATNGRYTMLELTDSYEVNIYADDAVRPIGAMSGGEADVIALSVRIAIAKMLLEAQGMPTQTFILDEIFGALDDERRESTCAALQGIQNELARILCITHIDEIKDMADYTYMVEMDENNVSYVREVVNENIMKSALVEEKLSGSNADDAERQEDMIVAETPVEVVTEESI